MTADTLDLLAPKFTDGPTRTFTCDGSMCPSLRSVVDTLGKGTVDRLTGEKMIVRTCEQIGGRDAGQCDAERLLAEPAIAAAMKGAQNA